MKKIVVFMCALVLITGCSKKEDDYKKLEKSFVAAVSKYYDENIIGQVYPPYSCQTVTISDMKNAGISVDEYTKKGCDESTVSAFVIVKDSSDPANIKYEVIPNLTCKGYSSTITDKQKSSNQCISTYLGK